MSGQTEIIVGYDAREYFSAFSKTWQKDRIDQYLLTDQIRKPLSTDVMVWDSIFHILEIELPNWVGPRQWTWDKLDRLTTFIANQQITRPYWLIAITEWVSTDVKAQLAARYQITPSTKSENWKCLGFDVSDAYLLSGLMNCGYTSEERQPLRDIWGNKLNPYHLFDRIEEAQAFRVMTDKRVAEHQPFSVYGLYLIKAS